MTKRPAKKSVKRATKTTAKTAVAKVAQPHGGALNVGGTPGNVGGPGRPPDEIRAKLRELGATKSLPFLSGLLDGKVDVSFIGTCEACQHEQKMSQEWVEMVMDRLKASIDQRLKAAEQTMKYGLATKELVIASDNARTFFDCVTKAIEEMFGAQAAEAVKARALSLVEQKA